MTYVGRGSSQNEKWKNPSWSNRRAQPVVDREMGEEFGDLVCSHFGGMPLAVKQDVLSNPLEVGLFGAIAIMKCADEVTHLFEQL